MMAARPSANVVYSSSVSQAAPARQSAPSRRDDGELRALCPVVAHAC